jgi:predicted nucleic acid-binding protein
VIFDALIVASALCADWGVLWSEDIQDGIVIDRQLQVADPFRAA